MRLIHKWNRFLLKRYPSLWMSLLHIILPVSIIVLFLEIYFLKPQLDLSEDLVSQIYLWCIFPPILFFGLLVVIYNYQKSRFINNIKFKTFLNFHIFCLIGYASISLIIFSPALAIISRIKQGEVGFKTYQKNLIIYALKNDSTIVLKNSQKVELSGPEDSTIDFEITEILFNNYTLNQHPLYDSMEISSTISNLLDSISTLKYYPNLSLTDSLVNKIQEIYELPSSSEYSIKKVSEWNQLWNHYSYSTLVRINFFALITKHFKFIFSFIFLFYIIFLTSGLAINYENITVLSKISLFLFGALIYMAFFLSWLFLKVASINIVSSILVICFLIMISSVVIVLTLKNKVNFKNWKISIFVYQFNFQLLSMSIILYSLFRELLPLHEYFVSLISFLPILLILIHFIYLKIYHKLFNLPKE